MFKICLQTDIEKKRKLVIVDEIDNPIDSESEGELVIDEDYSPSNYVKDSENNHDATKLIEPVSDDVQKNAVKRKSTDTIEGPVKKTKR